ncbi:MAG TPA: 6-phosphogluconolactonase [Gemmatimonadaceae bacterium]|nr:6-phosphogluconolactonase [Gemmatimonadaceae bacterium]
MTAEPAAGSGVGGRGAQRRVRVFEDLAAMSNAVAGALARAAEAAVAERGRFVIALAGGETPRALYRVLAERYGDRAFWGATHVFFGDERCVPPDDPASNYAMAEHELLSRVAVSDDRVYRVVGEAVPDDAARVYDALLHRTLGGGGDGAAAATFDVALLGVGADGHTASLFPGDDAALDEHERWALAVRAPASYAPRDRITLTLPALNASRAVWVLAAGAGKAPAVRAALAADDAGAEEIPASLVHGTAETVWHLDRAAAEGAGTG